MFFFSSSPLAVPPFPHPPPTGLQGAPTGTSMRSFAVFVLLAAVRALAAPSPSNSSSSSFPSIHPGAPSSSPPPTSLSPPPPTRSPQSSSPSVTPTSSTASVSSSASGNSTLPSSVSQTTTSISVLTEPGPSVIPVTPYVFEPFPSPSSEPPIPGVFPASSPKHPPPVESPALVPDFASAWARAYHKAKGKVGITSPFKDSRVSTCRLASYVCLV